MMLSYEVMGFLCLLTLWTTALLVAGSTWQDLSDVRALLARARRALRGRVASADDGVLAAWRLSQRGRALDGRDEAIAFHDRSFQSTVRGGSVRVGEQVYRVSGPGEVWLTEAARRSAAACTDVGAFDAAYKQATRAAGFQREVTVTVAEGDEVFLLGVVLGQDIVGGSDGLIVATFDPVSRLQAHVAMLAAFIVAELLACGGVTWVALLPPHFGVRSIAGAVLGLGFFLGVTPLGVSIREAVRAPSVAHLRGTWVRPEVTRLR